MTEAVMLYQQAINLCPPEEKQEKAIFHNNLGIALKKMDKKLQAKGEFSKAIECNDKYAKPLFHRMNLHKDNEDYDMAIEDAKKIIEIDPAFQRHQLEN